MGRIDSLVANNKRISIHIILSTVSLSRCLSGGRNCRVAGSLSMSCIYQLLTSKLSADRKAVSSDR